MKDYYQFMIYDNDREDCYNPDGVIVEVSNLYTNEESCREAAQEMVNEFDEQYETEARFQYEIISVQVVE